VHHAVYVVEGDAQSGVPAVSFFEAEFEELCVDESANERGTEGAKAEFMNELFYLFAYLRGEVSVDIGFADEGVDNALGVEQGEVFIRAADEKFKLARIV
jgi:hypothetical protein